MNIATNDNNKVEISELGLRANIESLEKFNSKIRIAPVLKSNAYGHGIQQVAPVIDSYQPVFVCVNSIYEAHQLRKIGVQSDILIMGYVDKEDLTQDWGYIFTAFDLEYIKTLAKRQSKLRVHINIETGLHRDGINFSEFELALNEIKQIPNIQIEGLMSHLACSNDPTCPTTVQQLVNFKKAKEIIASVGISPNWFHLGGSLALLNNLTEACNVVRCGKALFGIALNSSYQANTSLEIESNELQKILVPILKLSTKIAQIKHIKKGDHVSYSDSFVADHDMTIGILPIGYNDGVDRRLANRGFVKVGDVYCKMLGVIAMNVNVIDLSDVVDPYIGQEVIVYSDILSDRNSLDNFAQLCGTLPQDILLHLPTSVTRKLI